MVEHYESTVSTVTTQTHFRVSRWIFIFVNVLVCSYIIYIFLHNGHSALLDINFRFCIIVT